MTGDQLREESGDRRDPFHIADKDKKADECQEQKVVDPDKQRAVLYENSGQDDEKHDRPGIDPNDAAQTDEKKRQIEDQRSLRGTAVLVKGGPAEGDGFIFQQKNGRHLMIVGQKIPLSDSKNTSYQLLLVRDISEIYNNVLTQIGMFLIILGAIVAVAINAVFWMIRRMLKPLRDLRETAGAISQGQLDRRVRVRSNDEVGALSVSFNQMADQIECQMEELAQVSERRKQLLGSLAHELKTPMMAVQGCAEGIHTGVLDPVEASGVILEEAEQMSDLVEELLALSRLESGQANAEFHSMDVREVLYDCLRSTEQLAEQRKLCVTPCFDEKPVLVNCDEVQLRRAFTNIITNALRYAKGKIQIECKADRGKAVVRIHDDGEGIAPELLPHIFDRFFSTRKGGAGIGLSLAKEIVSLHKGTITASNDGGAVFEISLPLRKTI